MAEVALSAVASDVAIADGTPWFPQPRVVAHDGAPSGMQFSVLYRHTALQK
jgi:hypothetical protein